MLKIHIVGFILMLKVILNLKQFFIFHKKFQIICLMQIVIMIIEVFVYMYVVYI